MKQPALCIDVSKGKSVAAAFLALDDIFRKPFSFQHSKTDLASLLSLLDEMRELTECAPHIVLEATGHYSKSLVSFFESHAFPVVLLNPMLTHHQKKTSIRKIKTDAVDTFRIAQVFYLQYPKARVQMASEVLELQAYCRQADALNGMYTETQLHFQAVLDLLFPGYSKVFKHVCCPSSLLLLSAYPSPQDVLDADREDVFQLLLKNRRGKSFNEEKLDLLVEAAKESLPDPSAHHANVTSLHTYIHLLSVYHHALKEIQQNMICQAETFPAYSLLRSIPGVGPLTAATILGEIGDIQRFPSAKQLTAYAGLDASVFESGTTFKSRSNKISKRGSTYLRKALYQATFAGISKQKNGVRNPDLYEFYQRKKDEGKIHKVALIAASHKLLRIIYGVWTNQVPFSKSN